MGFQEDEEDEHPMSPTRMVPDQTRLITERPPYGNMIVLFKKPCPITLGPDYWCFLPTFIVFCVISYLIISLVLNNSSNHYFRMSALIICGGMCLSYLAVATSNPGIVLQGDFDEAEEEQNPMNRQNMRTKRLCRKCNFRVKKGTYHCRDCDVCVEGYDHHCPWTSKCIGRGNIIRFYIFLTFVPIYLVYIFIAFTTVLSTVAINRAKNHVRHG